ncbi:MAG: class I SAM-dependent methyltransferase [Solirubrobacteraceae bacterium]|nr:class I SAM-dependent methyltransferase [Solirubrobacteraceae bacterium]
MFGDDLRESLGATLPADHARQSNAGLVLEGQLGWMIDDGLRQIDEAAGVAPAGRRPPFVLDVGCGRGEGLDEVLRIAPKAHWLGVDLAQSAEVDERPARADAEFRTFDGVNLPLADRSVDLVFSQQVFEHVTEPERLLADIARVMKPGAIFCGSVSQLELFHSRSVGGFTAYGWKLALERAGIHPVEVRPGIDVGTLFARRLLARSRWFDRYWSRPSPGNRLVDGVARVRRLDHAQRNALKLMIAGQVTFVGQRPWG